MKTQARNVETTRCAPKVGPGSPQVEAKTTRRLSRLLSIVMQEFRADKYAGQRLRLSAFVKSEAVQEWAGLWMRVDKGSQPVGFDNMEDRSINSRMNRRT